MDADSAEVDRFTNTGSRCSSPRLSDTTAASGAGPMSGVTPESVRREVTRRNARRNAGIKAEEKELPP